MLSTTLCLSLRCAAITSSKSNHHYKSERAKRDRRA
ncbi:hypothetical protein T11_12849 [Trichinella zimbabwensis]|uniref:Uncharacterized protein n=1 Tax=Trichinella zimbabwensis TaxID=268475 RepID=A0A0V1GBF0_9BILA|nr:hypothetical protein T11_12849 [Trichinella zimbabwensis]